MALLLLHCYLPCDQKPYWDITVSFSVTEQNPKTAQYYHQDKKKKKTTE